MTLQPENTAQEDKACTWEDIFKSMQRLLTTNKEENPIENTQQTAVTALANLLSQQVGISNSITTERPQADVRIVHIAFVTNHLQEIQGFSSTASATLGYPIIRLLGRRFNTLLEKHSWADWDLLLQQTAQKPAFNRQLSLYFRTQSQLVVPAICSIERLFNTSEIRIEALLYWKEPSISETEQTKEIYFQKGSHDEKALAKALHDYILSHLAQPLPTIKALARMMATNDCKLKESFRNRYGTGIHQFYNSCRLNQARLLILQTSLPLTEIAEQSGFSNYPSFTKAFKKKFGFPPQQSRKHR